MSHPDKVDVGCNATREYRDVYQIDDNDIANLIKGIPDEVEVPKSVPIVGGTKIKVKENVKSVLDGLKNNPLQPTLIIRFTVQGNCDNFDNITIEAASHRLEGCHLGNITVAGVGIEVSLDVDISPEHMVVEDCKRQNGAAGEYHKRMFHITWMMKFSINPGLGGNFAVAEYDLPVYSCCCENFDDDDDDDDEEERGDSDEECESCQDADQQDDENERSETAPMSGVIYRYTHGVMPKNLGAVFASLSGDGEEHKDQEEEEKKKKFDEEKKRKQEEKNAKKQKPPKKHKHHEPEQGGAEHSTNKSTSKKDKHERGQRHRHREQWEKKRKHKNWKPFGKGKKKTQQPHKPPTEPPKQPEHPHSGETPKGGGSPDKPHGPRGS